jgi:molybdopterin-containing oxidoreductase family membrane subunit
MCFLIRKFTKFDPGREPIQKLALIVTYAMLANIFFILMEIFTAVYSGIPEHISHFQFLFLGLDGNYNLVPWMWTSVLLAITAAVMLLIPNVRKNEKTLLVICIFVFISIWIDKGMGMVVAGFTPSPLGEVIKYWPTIPEVAISIGVYAIGLLLVTGFYKIALSVRGEV